MIAFAVISVISLIAVQVYWVSRAVDEQEETFDHNVRMSLRSVADGMCQIDGNELIASKPIDRVANNYFIARLRYNIDVKSLQRLISNEFEKRNILQDYEYGVYNCENDRMVFGSQVSLAGGRTTDIKIPRLDEDEYYFGVYFPNKRGALLMELSVWKYMTAGSAMMLLFFSYGLVVVLKQRRLTEVQHEFIDNVTHELKTPIATLRLASDALKDQYSEAYVRIISEETERLQSQVEQIVQASMVEKIKASEELVDVSNLVEMAVERWQNENSMINWQTNIEADCKLVTNRTSLEISLNNLLDNAIKYGKGEVAVQLNRTIDNVVISVIDNGPGVPEKYRKKIFNKFFRVPTQDVHDVKGYGLGMFLVKEHLKKLKGRIDYRRVNQKTLFTINLPIK